MIVDVFCFTEVWMKKLTCTIVWRAQPVSFTKMCTSMFFIHTSMKRNKSFVSSYNLISNHFQAKLKGKQLWNKAKFKLARKRKNKLTNGQGGMIILKFELPSLKETHMSKYRLLKLFSFVFYCCLFYSFFIFDSNATVVTLFTMT